jgi:hypothetical protein
MQLCLDAGGFAAYCASAWLALELDPEKSFDGRVFLAVYAFILAFQYTGKLLHSATHNVPAYSCSFMIRTLCCAVHQMSLFV